MTEPTTDTRTDRTGRAGDTATETGAEGTTADAEGGAQGRGAARTGGRRADPGRPTDAGGRIEVQVRVAAAQDLAQAGALTAEAYHADRLLDGDGDYEAELRDAERRAREAVLLVAVVTPGPADRDGAEDVVVGTITLAPYGTSYAEVAEPGELELRMLAVAPEARHHGIAARLVAAAMREAVARGARGLVLSTLDSMHAAHRLYTRLGFVAVPGRDWGHEEIHLRVHTWAPPTPPGALVERATWVPVRTEQVDGWWLGLSDGATRRANSVLPLAVPEDLAATLDRVEKVYDEAGLATTVRVCGAAAPADLATVLAGRGYHEEGVSDVLVRGLDPDEPVSESDRALARSAAVRLVQTDRPDDAWLDLWLGARSDEQRRPAARAVLTGSGATYLTAVDRDGQAVGVLRAAPSEDWVGLSCVTVAASARRRGIGRVLTAAALRVAAQHGSRRAFLQVEVDNAGAADLYLGAGFTPAERYGYWVRPVA